MPRPVPDLVGQRFGKLVVEAPLKQGGRTVWRCRCDCGRESIAETGNLRRGMHLSCGCSRRGMRNNPHGRDPIDIAGERFGMLYAVSPTRLRGRPAWLCRCDCGKSKAVETGNLRTGNTTSCGCKRANPTFGGKTGPIHDRFCRRCGLPFRGWPRQVFCTDRCAQRWPKRMKYCPICGVDFLGRAERVYCDDRCRRIAWNQRSLARSRGSAPDQLATLTLTLKERLDDAEASRDDPGPAPDHD